MADYRTIVVAIDQGIARLTLNRPDRLNALSAQMHGELADAFDRIEAADGLRVLLLTGMGRGFCAGQDLGERKAVPGTPPDLGASLELHYNPLVRRISALPLPVLCAVNGVAAGAGANLALACDLVIATAGARFIQPFSNIGLLPDAGGTWHLPRLVGMPRALGLALTGGPIGARDAADWGMIWRAVPDDQFAAEVEALVARLAAAPTAALAATKRAMRSGWDRSLTAQLDVERDAQRALGLTDDYAEGVAAFLEKRAPRFRGA